MLQPVFVQHSYQTQTSWFLTSESRRYVNAIRPRTKPQMTSTNVTIVVSENAATNSVIAPKIPKNARTVITPKIKTNRIQIIESIADFFPSAIVFAMKIMMRPMIIAIIHETIFALMDTTFETPDAKMYAVRTPNLLEAPLGNINASLPASFCE